MRLTYDDQATANEEARAYRGDVVGRALGVLCELTVDLEARYKCLKPDHEMLQKIVEARRLTSRLYRTGVDKG